MRKLILAALVLLLFQTILYSAIPSKGQDKKGEKEKNIEKKVSIRADFSAGKFWVYQDKAAPVNRFAIRGWMGDIGDLRVNENWKERPHTGVSCVKIIYSAKGSANLGWAGLYWFKDHDKAAKEVAYNLKGAKKLKFWARGENGGENIDVFKVGGIKGQDPNSIPDSLSAQLGPVILTKDWMEYEIDLAKKDLAYVTGGFCWKAKAKDNKNGCAFYLDDIRFEK